MFNMSRQVLVCFILISSWGLFNACGTKTYPQAKSTAELIYLQGVDALESEDFLTADERFRTLKTKYLFSPFAALAELRLGDSALAQGRAYEAIQIYQTFTQARPQHQEVPYAYWRIGESYSRDRPSDLFLLPPTFERDRNPTKDALRALQKYVELYPQHKYVKRAQKLITSCRLDLASHELYVARFYRDQDQLVASRGRYELLLERFKDLDDLWRLSAEELIEVYQELKLNKKADQLAKQIKLAQGQE